MTTAAHRGDADRGEQGFVIIGVVMFVLALTILGLSLFSISSFESQFLGRSLSNEQAFSGAASGMERARFRMVASGTLDAAATVVGTDGVTYARAFQDGDSTGAIDGGGGNIEIRVRAGTGGSESSLRAEFQPGFGQDFYRRLATTSGPIVVVNTESGTPRCGSALFEGTVWQNSGNTAWTACASTPLPAIVVPPPAVPVPPVPAWIGAHPGGTPVVVTNVAGDDHYNLQGTAGAITYYRWTGGSVFPEWEMHAANRAVFNVTGYAVWVIPGGMYSFARITVNGNASDVLVIVAGKSGAPGQPGIEFANAIESANVPVILVSDGQIILNTTNNGAPTALTNYLSLYANGLEITGPDTPGQKLRMRHATGAAPDQPGGLIETLLTAGALPSPTTTAVPMAMVPSTWRQSSN